LFVSPFLSVVLWLVALLILVDSYLVLQRHSSLAEYVLGERFEIPRVRAWVGVAWLAVSAVLAICALLIKTNPQ
jgi:uncharacterized membrane protein